MAKTRAHPMARLLGWLATSSHRLELFWSVARLNASGIIPDQGEAMAAARRSYAVSSMISNGSQAIRDLIKAEFLVNNNPKRGTNALSLGWPLIGVISDWQEETGEDRLDEEIRSLDCGHAVWRPIPNIFEDMP